MIDKKLGLFRHLTVLLAIIALVRVGDVVRIARRLARRGDHRESASAIAASLVFGLGYWLALSPQA